MRLLEGNFCNHFFVLIMKASCQLLLTAFVLVITTWYSCTWYLGTVFSVKVLRYNIIKIEEKIKKYIL